MARYKPPPIKAQPKVVTGYRVVFTSGVPFGTVHRQPLYGEERAQRTICGNWPGLEIGAISADCGEITDCPVCFRLGPR